MWEIDSPPTVVLRELSLPGKYPPVSIALRILLNMTGKLGLPKLVLDRRFVKGSNSPETSNFVEIVRKLAKLFFECQPESLPLIAILFIISSSTFCVKYILIRRKLGSVCACRR